MPPVLQPVMRTDLVLLGAILLFFDDEKIISPECFSRNHPLKEIFSPFYTSFSQCIRSVS